MDLRDWIGYAERTGPVSDEITVKAEPEETRAAAAKAAAIKLELAHAAYEGDLASREELLRVVTERAGIDLTAATQKSREAFERLAKQVETATAELEDVEG